MYGAGLHFIKDDLGNFNPKTGKGADWLSTEAMASIMVWFLVWMKPEDENADQETASDTSV